MRNARGSLLGRLRFRMVKESLNSGVFFDGLVAHACQPVRNLLRERKEATTVRNREQDDADLPAPLRLSHGGRRLMS